jgi:hypothetical protein
MRFYRIMGLVAALSLLAVADAGAQDFEWRGTVDTGDQVEIKGVNGEIRASGVSGGEVVVTAVKKAKRSDPDQVRIEVVEHSDGVTICAVYPDKDDENECAPGSKGRLSSEDNDTEVAFTVSVPRGVNFVGKTVNGSIDAGGIEGNVKASTVNGDVDVSAGGLVRANTVNGSIHASMGSADWSGDLDFETVNGSITVELPASVNADVSAATVNGSMETDFPLTVTGRFSNRKMRGTIGSGGKDLSLETVNGSIHLKKN